MVRALNLKTQPITSLSVLVGNGHQLLCNSVCKGVPIHIQSKVFTLDIYAMLLAGAKVVFDVHWLKSLGLVVMDYSILSLHFMKDNKMVKLKGLSTQHPTKMTHH